jgi:hypothetical protein
VARSRFATKGLAAIVPWEGMADLYRDSCRHGGIASHQFVELWWNRQVVSNQYGLPGRKAASWGPDTIEGDLDPNEPAANRVSQPNEVVIGILLFPNYELASTVFKGGAVYIWI